MHSSVQQSENNILPFQIRLLFLKAADRGIRTLIWRQKPTPLCSDVSLMSMNLIRGPALFRVFGSSPRTYACKWSDAAIYASMQVVFIACGQEAGTECWVPRYALPVLTCDDGWSFALWSVCIRLEGRDSHPERKFCAKMFHACVYKASSGASNLLLTCWPGASALQRFTTEPQARVKKNIYISIYTLVSMKEKKSL